MTGHGSDFDVHSGPEVQQIAFAPAIMREREQPPAEDSCLRPEVRLAELAEEVCGLLSQTGKLNDSFLRPLMALLRLNGVLPDRNETLECESAVSMRYLTEPAVCPSETPAFQAADDVAKPATPAVSASASADNTAERNATEFSRWFSSAIDPKGSSSVPPTTVVEATAQPPRAAAPAPLPSPAVPSYGTPPEQKTVTAAAPTLSMAQVMESALRTLALLKLKISCVTAVAKVDDGWKVAAELVERAGVPDTSDFLGLYELRLDSSGQVLSYERVGLRRRCDLSR